MKKKTIRRPLALLCTLVLMFSLSLSAFAVNTDKQSQIDISIVKLSKTTAEDFFTAALERSPSIYGIEGAEIIDGGIVAYSNGYVKQTIVITQNSARSGVVAALATDHWFRLFDANSPVCDVSIICTFRYDGTIATCLKEQFTFKYEIWPNFEDNTYVNETSTTFKNGVTGSPTAKVDCKYSVNFMTLLDNETISIACDKDGTITRWEQDESI